MARHGSITVVPPVILAIENTSLCGSVALVCPGACLAETTLTSRQTHSKRLLTTIDRLLRDTGIELAAVDGIGVSLGPGSFTGLRIGLATAKGLAMATGKPLVGVPTLDGLASQLAYQDRIVCPVQDARKQEVFTARYRPDGRGGIERLTDYQALPPDRLAAEITEPTVFVGDALALYGTLFADRLGDRAIFAPATLHHPRAAAIGAIAVERFQNGDTIDPARCTPIYVRASDAERNAR